jgi:hypothetical protein
MMKRYLYIDDVLEEASAAGYQMLPKKFKLRYQKELEKFTSERKWLYSRVMYLVLFDISIESDE